MQLHNLPIDFEDGESHESLTTHLGPLLKVDDLTISLAQSKFARVCIEIDLSKPLCHGFWVGDSSHHVFVLILYERLPIFCYSWGIISHWSSSCPRVAVAEKGRTHPPLHFQRRTEVGSSSGADVVARMTNLNVADTDSPSNDISMEFIWPSLESEFYPWMLVARWRS